MEKTKLSVVGLGYVGMPIAVAFAEEYVEVIGFDINKNKLIHTKLDMIQQMK